MKKILVFLCLIVFIFVGAQIYVSVSNGKVNGEETRYKKKDLHPKTIEQLKDSNYDNIITPRKLDELFAKEELTVVYFYSSTCAFCKKATPALVRISKDINKELHLYNLLEFDAGWDQFKIEKTPTLVIFKKGKEFKRLEGLKDQTEYREFFDSYISNK
ncbi:thioredoxin family protein [Bacillus toyonensis]|uniref:thioredoxin family protein n=1 Tax=Bacillus toyonensis TaxID=155322 RepID=UPI00380A46F8